MTSLYNILAMPTASAPLAAWSSYYVIVGSSAGALTGLMFVVVTLMAELEMRSSRRTFEAFASPTIVHFCVALVISAAMSAPWPNMSMIALFLDGCGAAGVVYCITVARRTLRQEQYKPVFEDWVWHVILPHLAYFAVIAAGIFVASAPTRSLFALAAATLLLILIGIHNAWDTVSYLALEFRPSAQKDADQKSDRAPGA
jgi:hypothetical protein